MSEILTKIGMAVAEKMAEKITISLIDKLKVKTRFGELTFIVTYIISYEETPTIAEALRDLEHVLKYRKKDPKGTYLEIMDKRFNVIDINLYTIPLYEENELHTKDEEDNGGDEEERYGGQYVRRIYIILAMTDSDIASFLALKKFLLEIAYYFQGRAKTFLVLRVYPASTKEVEQLIKFKNELEKHNIDIEYGRHSIDGRFIDFLKIIVALKDVDSLEKIGQLLQRKLPLIGLRKNI